MHTKSTVEESFPIAGEKLVKIRSHLKAVPTRPLQKSATVSLPLLLTKPVPLSEIDVRVMHQRYSLPVLCLWHRQLHSTTTAQ